MKENNVDTIHLIYVPCVNRDEAKKIALMLLEKKLIACANIIPEMVSLYHWGKNGSEEKLCEESESLLLMKSPTQYFETIKEEILKIHSYELPCIVAIKLNDGNNEYIEWVLNMGRLV